MFFVHHKVFFVALNIGAYSTNTRIVSAAILVWLAQALHAEIPTAPMVNTLTPIEACVIVDDNRLTDAARAQIAECLGWQSVPEQRMCHGLYRLDAVESLPPDITKITADTVSLYSVGRSDLKGHVDIHTGTRVVSAQTASLYRDPDTQKVTRIELLGRVRYAEPGRLMLAKKVTLHPEDNTGEVEEVVYRLIMNGPVRSCLHEACTFYSTVCQSRLMVKKRNLQHMPAANTGLGSSRS